MLDYFYIYPFLDKVRLVWQYSNANMAHVPFFFVERSIDNQDTWERLNTSGIDGYMFEDETLPKANQKNTTWYRLIVSIDSVETTLEMDQLFSNWSPTAYRLIHSSIMAEQNRLKRSQAGVQGYYRKRRTAGIACSCLDPVTGAPTNPKCADCQGTLMRDGFYAGVELWTQYKVLKEYGRDWRAETGSYTKDARVIRLPAYIVWREGDRWSDGHTGQEYYFTSQYQVRSSLQGVPVYYEGIFDIVESGAFSGSGTLGPTPPPPADTINRDVKTSLLLEFNLAQNSAYVEMEWSGTQIAAKHIWVDATKNTKLFTATYGYTGKLITSKTVVDEVNQRTLTKSINYNADNTFSDSFTEIT